MKPPMKAWLAIAVVVGPNAGTQAQQNAQAKPANSPASTECEPAAINRPACDQPEPSEDVDQSLPTAPVSNPGRQSRWFAL